MQSQLVSHFRCTHGIGQILLVGKDQKHGIAQLVLVQHSVQLVTRRIDTVRVIRIHDENEALRVLVVVAPQGADLILTAHIPDCKGDVLVFDRLDVKANGRNGGDNWKNRVEAVSRTKNGINSEATAIGLPSPSLSL